MDTHAAMLVPPAPKQVMPEHWANARVAVTITHPGRPVVTPEPLLQQRLTLIMTLLTAATAETQTQGFPLPALPNLGEQPPRVGTQFTFTIRAVRELLGSAVWEGAFQKKGRMVVECQSIMSSIGGVEDTLYNPLWFLIMCLSRWRHHIYEIKILQICVWYKASGRMGCR